MAFDHGLLRKRKEQPAITPPQSRRLALVRQVGTTVAPALLLGFVSATPGAQGFFHMLLCAAMFCVISLVRMAFTARNKTRRLHRGPSETPPTSR